MDEMKLRALDPLLHPQYEDVLYEESLFVEHFYELITRSIEPPFAISIDGLWGTGKTTVMKMLQNRLEAKFKITDQSLRELKDYKEINNTIILEKLKNLENQAYKDQKEFINDLEATIGEYEVKKHQLKLLKYCQLDKISYPAFWFNPWEYQEAESVVLAFLQQFTDNMLGTVSDTVRKSLKILGTISLLGLNVALGALPGAIVTLLERIEDPKKIKETGELFEKEYEKYKDVIQIIQNDFRKLINGVSEKYNGEPVFVFFDDLDRCLPDKTIQLLEAVKNLFVVPASQVIFICGIDTHIAKQFIKSHYKNIEDSFAINYFRKIFNLTVSMPQSPGVRTLLIEYIKELYGWDEQDSEKLANKIYNPGVQAEIVSIRKYLNVINNFYTFQKFNPNCRFDGEKDFVIHLLIIKETWQSLYELIVKQALRERTKSMGALVQDVLKNCKTGNYPFTKVEKSFLEYYFVRDKSPFCNVKLADDFLYKYPTLT